MRHHWHWWLSVLAAAIFVSWWQLTWCNEWGWPDIVGKGTSNLIDVWSFQHLAAGILVEVLFRNRAQSMWGAGYQVRFMSAALVIAYAVELVELWVETGGAGAPAAAWFDGVEHWSNRIIADPLIMILGMLTCRRYPKCAWPAAGFVISWVLIHMFAPKCMYVQDLVADMFYLS